jgi:hypothetical protein
MPVALIGVANKKAFDLGVNGPDDIRTLVIATGVAQFAFRSLINASISGLLSRKSSIL